VRSVDVSAKLLRHFGEVSERFKEHAWKACVGEILPWVRIPPSPPFLQFQRVSAFLKCFRKKSPDSRSFGSLAGDFLARSKFTFYRYFNMGDAFPVAGLHAPGFAEYIPQNNNGRRRLFAQIGRRATDSAIREVDVDVDAVGDLNEGNTAVHPVLFPVESHIADDLARACSRAGNR
jgi:hypothetical protein